MSAIVDYQFYSESYIGDEADETSFPTLNAHASRIISAMTRWRVTEDTISEFSPIIQTQIKLAICSQIDYLAINGLESINSGDSGGFTVGKVTVHNGSNSGTAGAMGVGVSPAAKLYLEQTGLLYPGVAVVQC